MRLVPGYARDRHILGKLHSLRHSLGIFSLIFVCRIQLRNLIGRKQISVEVATQDAMYIEMTKLCLNTVVLTSRCGSCSYFRSTCTVQL